MNKMAVFYAWSLERASTCLNAFPVGKDKSVLIPLVTLFI